MIKWKKHSFCDSQKMYLTLLVAMTTMSISFCDVIDEREYAKMPKMFALEDYTECLLDPGGVYCLADVRLRAPEKPSELWYQIKNFSADTNKHYRHDVLHRGVCVTTTCGGGNSSSSPSSSSTSDTEHVLQRCLNESTVRRYGLESDVSVQYCETPDSRPPFDTADWCYIGLLVLVVLVNLGGTVHHLKGGENSVLKSFSVIDNWKRLMSKRIQTKDERKASLRGVQGMRFMTMLAVIFAHVVLIIPYGYVRNTSRIEQAYSDPLMQLLYNGSLVVQTFFTIASFLMSYHFLIYMEKKKSPSIKLYILIVLQRLMRLTPIYAMVIGFVSTLGEKLGSGPQWRHIVISEAEVCKQYWWANLLYINNYVHESHHCLPQSWYMAADTQLFCYGALVMMIAWKYPGIKRMLFGVLMIVAVLIPATIIFANRLPATVKQGPENFRKLYVGDETFFNVYITMEGNMAGYTLGLICGCLQYYYDENKITLRNHKWFNYMLYFLFPLGVLEILTGAIFITEGYVYNPLVAAAYGALYKPVFSLLVLLFIMGLVHKCDTIMKAIVEWEGFQILGKLSFCAYLSHTIPQRSFIGLIKEPFDVVEYNIVAMFAASVSVTYIIAWALCICIEMPFGNLQKLIFAEPTKGDEEKDSPTSLANGREICNADLVEKSQNSRL